MPWANNGEKLNGQKCIFLRPLPLAPLSCLLLALLGGADMVRAAQRTALTTAGGKVI